MDKNLNAYVSYLCNDKFLEGVIALQKSLKRVDSQFDLYCMVTEEVTEDCRNKLKENGVQLINVEKIQVKRSDGIKDRYRENSWMMFTKLNLWKLIQFQSIIYLDADVIALKNIDQVFGLSNKCNFAAVKDMGYDGLSAGVMFLKPSIDTFNDMMNNIENEEYDNTYSDQSFTNWYFAIKNKNWYQLPDILNVLEKRVPFEANFNQIAIFHYNGQKPWLVDPQDNCSWQQGENLAYIFWHYIRRYNEKL